MPTTEDNKAVNALIRAGRLSSRSLPDEDDAAEDAVLALIEAAASAAEAPTIEELFSRVVKAKAKKGLSK